MSLPSRMFPIVSLLFAAAALAQSAPAKPIAPDAHPSFAVATIKPHNPEASHQSGIYVAGDDFNIRNESEANMMVFAYSIHARQIVAAPDSFFHDRWDIEGKPDVEGEPRGSQMQEMVQKLLADRFSLKFHRDRRELPVYALQIAKGGPKLTSAKHPEAQADEESSGQGAAEVVTCRSCTMQDFILSEQRFLDRPLVDQTGLAGLRSKYDFSLHYTWDESKPDADPDVPPGLFTAIQEQLGLKLVPTKAPADVFVIDHVEQPLAN